MISFEALNTESGDLGRAYQDAQPYPHVIIDAACDADRLRASIPAVLERLSHGADSSGDLIFAKNKFVDSEFAAVTTDLSELRDDLLSKRFAVWLSRLVGEEVFVDPAFYGGGLHAGGAGSFLDMHTDFSFHPQHLNWRRRLNILLYLNDDWLPMHGGELLLQDIKDEGMEPKQVAPIFNRLVVMETGSQTLHGYDPISFPEGHYRMSIAAYAYSLEDQECASPQSTVWYPRKGGVVKRLAGKWIPRMIAAFRSIGRR
ncbi:conserved hypothetical protein [gamma proteobacterium NOR5-3]|nr:conserved hypothetical protein [gamma proteobacterium NOR5-3]